MADPISVNRAPVLTLWAAVVAERLGYDPDEALTLGRALAGLNAQSKGRALGIFAPATRAGTAAHRRRAREGAKETIELLHRAIPVVKTDAGFRALSDGRPIAPESVRRYLASKFGDDLDAVRRAMETLARSRTPKRIAEEAYALYESFRPRIPPGTKGWGKPGLLDLGTIRALARDAG
ncbi:MAG: hypothetical protein ACM3JJ_12810 [Hyphomicrobiales bacterium]